MLLEVLSTWSWSAVPSVRQLQWMEGRFRWMPRMQGAGHRLSRLGTVRRLFRGSGVRMEGTCLMFSFLLVRWRGWGATLESVRLTHVSGLCRRSVWRLDMSVRVTRRSRLVVALLALVSFVVAGCKTEGTIEFRANGDMKLDFTFEDSRDTMAKINQTCEGVRLIVEANATFIDDPKVEDVTPAGGHLTCRLTSDKPFKGNMKLTEQDGKYHFKSHGAHDDTKLNGFEGRVVVSMPGKVTRSSLGKVQGNKVILEDLDFLTYGIEITAEKKSAPPSPSSSSGKKADAASSASAGAPMWVWAAIGGGVLVVIAGCAFVMGRRRGTAKAAASNRRQDGMAAVDGGVPTSDGGVSAAPYQRAFGDGPGQDSHGCFRP